MYGILLTPWSQPAEDEAGKGGKGGAGRLLESSSSSSSSSSRGLDRLQGNVTGFVLTAYFNVRSTVMLSEQRARAVRGELLCMGWMSGVDREEVFKQIKAKKQVVDRRKCCKTALIQDPHKCLLLFFLSGTLSSRLSPTPEPKTNKPPQPRSSVAHSRHHLPVSQTSHDY